MSSIPVSWGTLSKTSAGRSDDSSPVITAVIIMAKTAVPIVDPMDLIRFTDDVVIPISDGLELFWTADMTTDIMHPRPRPRMNVLRQ